MTATETAKAHARAASLAWHRDRANGCRASLTAPGLSDESREYLSAVAAWHEAVADGIARQIQVGRTND